MIFALTSLTALRNRFAGVLVGLLMGLCAVPAAADVWGYIDAKGTAHFSTEKLDERYELFFKSGESFSTGQSGKLSLKPAENNTINPDAPPDSSSRAPTKLLAFFDASPNYKAVRHLLKDASHTHGIDYELLQALIATESGFDTFAVSPKGAVGLMQLMPPTAERYGVKADKKIPIQTKLTDPKTNIRAGASYLRDLIKMFPGQLELALASYNAGEGAVKRAGNKIPNYPETKNYVKTVMQLYSYLKPPGKQIESAPEAHRTFGRVRMEMMGGNPGRSNMPPALAGLPVGQPASPEPKTDPKANPRPEFKTVPN